MGPDRPGTWKEWTIAFGVNLALAGFIVLALWLEK